MCGFAGVWRPPGAPDVDPGQLHALLPYLRRRGPDQEGVRVRGRFGLVATRLRIRGGAEGDQPLASAGRDLWLAFNGEVLLEEGLEPGRADSAAVLAACGNGGAAAAMRLLRGGMGALALFDESRQELTLARDVLGIKPLYVARTAEGGFAFASEIAPLLVLSPRSRDLDATGLAELLTWHRPRTRLPFVGVRAVEPGSLLRVRSTASGAWHEEHTRPTRPLEPWPGPTDAESLWSAVSTAAARAAQHAGPVSVLLSGGLDSAATLLGAARTDLHAITGRFAPVGGPLDESAGAAQVAAVAGAPHEIVDLDDAALVEALPAVARALEVPLAGPGSLSLWLLAPRLAARGRVVLSGTGGDEWFGGYARSALALGRRGIWTAGYEALEQHIGGAEVPPAERLRRCFDRAPVLRPLLDRDFLAGLPAVAPPTLKPGEGLAQALRREEVDGTLAALLQVEDRVLMAHAVEARPVLCLGDVPRFAAQLDADTLIGPDGEGKRLLRQALRGRIPEGVRTDPRKRGFPTPFARAARGAGREQVRTWLSDAAFRQRGWWNVPACQALLDEARPAHDRALFSLLLIEWWARHFLDVPRDQGEAARP